MQDSSPSASSCAHRLWQSRVHIRPISPAHDATSRAKLPQSSSVNRNPQLKPYPRIVDPFWDQDTLQGCWAEEEHPISSEWPNRAYDRSILFSPFSLDGSWLMSIIWQDCNPKRLTWFGKYHLIELPEHWMSQGWTRSISKRRKEQWSEEQFVKNSIK